MGQGVIENRYSLFRKLRREGVYFKRVNAARGFETILEAVQQRATAHPVAYGHWYLEGGAAAKSFDGVTCVSYQSLATARRVLADKMRAAYESPAFGAEALRTMLAEIRPEELGLEGTGADAVLDRFQLSILTEGSGTQVFSTTFVQWAAREVLRRAQPVTLLAHFTPRRREQPMNELLSGVERKPVTDPEGSLIDADMGAYYTWINQQRLSGADRSSFLVWFEDHTEAVAIGPGLSRGIENNTEIDMAQILRSIA